MSLNLPPHVVFSVHTCSGALINAYVYIYIYIAISLLFIGRWEFVWGKDSKNYSEEVIKSYLCKHGSIVQENTGAQLTIVGLSAIYFGGSAEYRRRENTQLGRQLAQLIHDGKLTFQ